MTAAGGRTAAFTAVLALSVVLGVGAHAAVGAESASGLSPPPSPVVAGPVDGWPAPTSSPDVAAHLLVEAETGQVLAAHGAEVPRAVASTVKVLTALTAVERTEPGEEVTAGEEVLAVPGSGVGLEPGDTWRVDELIDAVIARSGNDAAEALAVHVAGDREAFLELMEADAAALGLDLAPLVSVSGLDDGNRLTATDLAVIARAALAHDELRDHLARGHVELPSEGRLASRNELLATYPGASGVKTGFTEEAGNSLVASAVRDGRELVAVVLGAGDDPTRFEVAAGLLDLGFSSYAPHDIDARLTLRVAGGEVGYELAPLAVSTPVGDPPVAAWPVPSRVTDEVTAEVHAAGQVLTRTAVPRGSDPPARLDGTAGIGQAVADGVYASLRAAVGDDGSGSLVTSSQGALP